MASGDSHNLKTTDKSAAMSEEEESCVSVSDEEDSDKPECAICLQSCTQPVRLPCSHIFCYLCVKGITQQSKKCAMCRQPIPANFLDKPKLLSIDIPKLVFDGSYQWFYEGKNGWWQYDERTSKEIESAYQKKVKQCEVLIVGFLYVIDFENNVQYRKDSPSRRRKIKRDVVSIPKKGVAGIHLPVNPKSTGDGNPSLQNLNLCDTSNSSCSAQSKNSSSKPDTSTGTQKASHVAPPTLQHLLLPINVTSSATQPPTAGLASVNVPPLYLPQFLIPMPLLPFLNPVQYSSPWARCYTGPSTSTHAHSCTCRTMPSAHHCCAGPSTSTVHSHCCAGSSANGVSSDGPQGNSSVTGSAASDSELPSNTAATTANCPSRLSKKKRAHNDPLPPVADKVIKKEEQP